MTSRIVVFGGRGFVGSAIVRGLPAGVVAPPRSEIDLTSAEQIRGILRPDDVVINAAGYASATDRSPAGLARLRRDNVEAVTMLADAAASAGASELIHISSVAAMGQRSGSNLVETDLAPPRSPYGQSKRDAELALAGYGDRLPITILRPTSIFGEERGLTAVLCRIAGLPIIPMPAGGRALVPLSYVGNLVEAVRLTIGRATCHGRTFIVGDNESYALGEVIKSLAGALGHDRRPAVAVPRRVLSALGGIESRVAAVRGRSPLLDPIRIETLTSSVSYSTRSFRDATGFEPPYTLEAALERVAEAYRRRRVA
jgi:nucleoside-diphosphate-sugar epimerase